MDKIAIEVAHVTKIYPLYQRKSDRLKEALSPARRKRHEDFYALRDISFSVREGECVGFVGKNGCGKSTLLKILTGVLTPTMGTFSIEGKIAALLELGAGFNADYTGVENIYLNGAVMGFSREQMEQKVEAILEFADIGDFAYQPVKMYSSGMFVRLAFAVAINVDPEILIIDEALSVGDIFFQQKCYKKFQEFKQTGRTILFVTHDLGSIIKYCDRAFLMNQGELITEGEPKDIVDQYKKLIAGLDISTLKQEAEAQEILQPKEHKTQKHEEGKVDKSIWKTCYSLNPQLLEYGEKELEIVDFGIFDQQGKVALSCLKGEEYTIRMKVRVNKVVQDPIFAMTIKDVKGTEVTGTNTEYEKTAIPKLCEGDVLTVSFCQKIDLQNSQYFISFGCTKYLNDGELKIYHRIYDVISLNVVTEKSTIGWFDTNTRIEIVKEEE